MTHTKTDEMKIEKVVKWFKASSIGKVSKLDEESVRQIATYCYQNPSPAVEGIIKAHQETNRVIGNFLDRITPEAAAKPDLSTAHLGMIEALHCYNRSKRALEAYEKERAR